MFLEREENFIWGISETLSSEDKNEIMMIMMMQG
jgi:hypothetical protein